MFSHFLLSILIFSVSVVSGPLLYENDNILGANWTNGSLDQEEGYGVHPWKEWSPAGNASQPVNLTILPDNIAALIFPVPLNDTGPQNIAARFALARTILSNEYNSGGIGCMYPLSGSYDFLTRVLFYLLMFFALLYRRHSWVAVAALGTAMTYSATTAVHALALLTQFGWHNGRPNPESSKDYGDTDILGTYPILLTALVMVTPILNWSANVRRDKAQIILILWGMLSFAALVPVMVYISQTAGGTDFRSWSLNGMGALMLCPRSVAEDNLDCALTSYPTRKQYEQCECIDFCALLGPTAPMRHGASMVPMFTHPFIIDLSNNTVFMFVNYWSQALAAMIVCFGGIQLILNFFNLREMRDLFLRMFYKPGLTTLMRIGRAKSTSAILVNHDVDSFRSARASPWFMVVKTIAALYYLLGVFIGFISPLILLVIIGVVETGIFLAPESEENDAVGAWSPWVGAAIIILVAIVLHFQDHWQHLLRVFGYWFLRIAGFGGLVEKLEEQRPEPPSKNVGVLTRIRNFFTHLFKCSVYGAFCTVRSTLKEYNSWLRAPPPHPQLCGCDRCIEYRNLIRKTRELDDHANTCPCDKCYAFRDQVDNLTKDHDSIDGGNIRKVKKCGCEMCSLQREQAHWKRRIVDQRPCEHCEPEYEAISNPAGKPADDVKYESRGYQTLGIRLWRRFDRVMINLLEEADNQRRQRPSQTSIKPSPTVGTEMITMPASPKSAASVSPPVSPRSSIASVRSQPSNPPAPAASSSTSRINQTTP
ncbi:hypothetical protein BU24DRAFT_428209 [Aaosphaeria arxii CBS 175.79]|uniref:Integral membrane protein n=1 Tax=Aaosphaeria arxii CBS 175.79 TaxID=1450172 RepID=A0A6A5XBB0_9PLEO|nr:uncharacterized protein BU24DRAFT_428209 [Aaosphaeria arxii CBS 175.79]KAF2010189.1 hypothetical protein BU24DRAFT_428209 [Aaosphaeria arxii CBS 175.79]